MLACQAAAREFKIEQLAIKKTQLAAANETLTGLLEKEVQSFTLDTTEGEQRSNRQRIDRLSEVKQRLEAEILQLIREIYGCSGLVHLNMRRTY